MKQNTKFFYLILILFIQAFAHQAKAKGSSSTGQLIEYSLSVGSQTSDMAFQSGTSYQSKTNHIGIAWYESFNAYFSGGLEFGYLEMSQIENNLASAQFTTGQFAGLRFRFIPLKHSLLSLRVFLNYRYNLTRGVTSNQESQFIWSELSFSNQVDFHITHSIDLFLAVDYQLLDGTLKNTGILNQASSFKGGESQNMRLGTKIMVNPNGEIRLEYSNGFADGVSIHFIRLF